MASSYYELPGKSISGFVFSGKKRGRRGRIREEGEKIEKKEGVKGLKKRKKRKKRYPMHLPDLYI